MEVCSAISGETLAFGEEDEFEGKSARTVKQFLATQLGISRFRQRLVVEDDSKPILDDDVLASLPSMKIQLVVLAFEQTEGSSAVNQMISACEDNRADKLENLLQCPRNPDLTDELGRTPLYHAAGHGHLKLATTGNRIAPLFIASRQGHVKVVRLLIEAGADKNQLTTDDGSSPLFIASRQGHVKVVRLLIEAGVDKNQLTTDDCSSPLHIASRQGHVKVVRLLIEAGVDKKQLTTDDASSPLYIASRQGHVEVVRLLIETGVDKDQLTTDDGASPLDIASQNGHLEVVRLLIEAAAD
eukprot:Skav209382  [mRNA]  locus=scaffold3334:6755:8099:- [translate_table: standard]